MKRLLHFLAGKYLWTPRILEALASSLALLLWFDIDWCMATTFRAMSDPLLWINTVAATLTLTLPYVATRRVWVHVAVLAVAFGICGANRMYCRTYLTAIPPDSYLLAGNLSDFTASVADSIRWLDWIGLLIVVDTAIVMRRMPSIRPGRRAFMRLSSLTLLICSVSAIWIAARGGFLALTTSSYSHAITARAASRPIPLPATWPIACSMPDGATAPTPGRRSTAG